MKKFLTAIDIFGEAVKIYLNNQSKIKSAIGGILTILMICLITNFCWFMGRDIYYKETPFSFEQKVYSIDFPEKFINSSIFPISAAIYDFNNVPILDDRILQLKSYIIQTLTTDNSTETNILDTIEMINCRYEDFPKLTVQQFDKAQLGNTLCLKNSSYSLKGFWGENEIRYINVVVEMCDYDKRPDYCLSKDEIKKWIGSTGANFNIYYIQNAIDLKNFNNPIKPFVDNVYTYFDSDKYKVGEYFVTNSNVKSDCGIIFEDFREQSFSNLLKIQVDSLDFDDNDKKLMSFIIYSGNITDTYFRKYIKIAEIIASAGGLYKIFQIVFEFINVIFTRFIKLETAIENIFYFNLDEYNNKNEQNKFQIIENQSKYSNYSSKNTIIKETSIRSLFRNRINHDIHKIKLLENLRKKHESRHLRITYCEIITIIRRYCCPNTKINNKLRIYLKGVKKIKESFDFIHIIKHIEEFKTIKKFIFTDSQRQLFDLFVRPKLNRSFQEKCENRRSKKPNYHNDLINNFVSRVKNNHNSLNSQTDNILIKLISEYD